MRCEDALVTMLEAEPADLVPGAGDLGVHIGSCPRCSAVAKTLSGETARLAQAFAGPNSVASAVEYRARQRHLRQYVISPAAVLAASVMLWTAFRAPSESVQPQEIENPVATAIVPAATPRVIATLKAAPSADPTLVRLPPMPPTLPVAVQAVAAVATAREPKMPSPDFQIDPEPGTLATVMHAREARVTVVWFTK